MNKYGIEGAREEARGPSNYQVRATALEAALKTNQTVPGADAVVRAAQAYLTFLTTTNTEQN